MAPRLLPRFALGLVGAAVATVINAAPLADQTGRSVAARTAEWLQDCLDRDEHIVTTSDLMSANGRMESQVHSAAASTGAPAKLAKQLARCAAPQASTESCALGGNLRQPVALEVIEGERHPAWNANDRARLIDLLPARLHRMAETQPRVTIVDGPDAAAAGLRLRAEIEYEGTGLSQRYADEWINPARQLRVHLSLLDRANREVVVARDVKVKLGWEARTRRNQTSSAPWFTETISAIDAGAREMLAGLRCQPDVLSASRTPTGRWQMHMEGREGVEVGRTVLLIPANDATLSSRWPIARVASVTGTRTADLEFIRGDETACSSDGCTALVL